MTRPSDTERAQQNEHRRQHRQQALAAYRQHLERSRLNRQHWPAELATAVRQAETRIAAALTLQGVR